MSPSGCIGRKASTAVGVDWRNPGCTIPWLLGGRAGVDVNGSHVLSQCLLAAIPLIGGQAGAGVVRTGGRY